MNKNNRLSFIINVIILCAIVGIIDAGYLTYEHFSNAIIPCSTSGFIDCGAVLKSTYSILFGIPLVIIGLVHYGVFYIVAHQVKRYRKQLMVNLLFLLGFIGFIASLYFVYLQIIVIHAICLYCMVSAINSLILFALSIYIFILYGKRKY